MLVDISRLLDRAARGRLPTGVDRVVLGYLERFGGRARALVQKGGWRRILGATHSQELFGLLLQPPPDFARRMRGAIARACLPPWPEQDAQGAVALHLGQAGLEKPGFADWIKRTRQTPVFCIYDLIPITHPEYCRAGEDAKHAERIRVMLECGAGLVAISHETLSDFRAHAERLKLPLPPAVVAPLAPAPLVFKENKAPALAAPYFVALGTIEPRKNHLLLLNVWRELAGRLGANTPKLVVLGQRGWECEQVVDMLERCAVLKPHVLEVPHCTDAELAGWLQNARALLFPSFTEGYGMPLVEAFSVGTPVVASDLPVFKEIAGDVPDYLSPIDGVGWMQAVLDYSQDGSPRRSAQLRRIEGYEVPNWNDHFSAVETLLDRISAGTSSARVA